MIGPMKRALLEREKKKIEKQFLARVKEIGNASPELEMVFRRCLEFRVSESGRVQARMLDDPEYAVVTDPNDPLRYSERDSHGRKVLLFMPLAATTQ